MSRRVLVVVAMVGLSITLAGTAWFAQARHAQARARTWKPRLVVLLAIDTLRADHLGCYGYERDTSPFIDEMARQGVLFERAFSQSNRTLASFSSILTGRFQTVVPANFVLPAEESTIASVLQSYGVRTLASVAGGHLNHGFGLGRGFDVYNDTQNFASLQHTLPDVLKWIDETAAQPRQTFIFLHGYDVHMPYHKPLIFNGLFDPGYMGTADGIIKSGSADNRIWNDRYFVNHDGEATRIRTRALYEKGVGSVHLSEADKRHIVAGYDGAIAYADICVGRLLNHLRAKGLADDTLVVLIGDHGEQMLEKGFLGHGIDLDDRELHVPLILWAPGALQPRRLPQVVELLDVMPTILDFFGLTPTDFTGRSLRPLALGDGGDSTLAVSVSAAGVSARDEHYRLVQAVPLPMPHGYDMVDGLYEASDTAARVNLLDRPDKADVVARLRERLYERLPFARR